MEERLSGLINTELQVHPLTLETSVLPAARSQKSTPGGAALYASPSPLFFLFLLYSFLTFSRDYRLSGIVHMVVVLLTVQQQWKCTIYHLRQLGKQCGRDEVLWAGSSLTWHQQSYIRDQFLLFVFN